jgi:hypothetical protein
LHAQARSLDAKKGSKKISFFLNQQLKSIKTYLCFVLFLIPEKRAEKKKTSRCFKNRFFPIKERLALGGQSRA